MIARLTLVLALTLHALAAAAADPAAYLLKPARVFDGVDPKPHEGWAVLVRGDRIEAAGPAVAAPQAPGPGAVIPQGAEEADGANLVSAVRHQIGAGADVVKLYADYRWRPGEPSRPTFSEAEMRAAVEAAHGAGRIVAAHANTAEGMRRAILAGV